MEGTTTTKTIKKGKNGKVTKTVKRRVKRINNKRFNSSAFRNPYKVGVIRNLNNVGNPNSFLRRANVSAMQRYYNRRNYEYLYALLNPEYAVKNKMSVKFPSYTPMPTQTLHIQNDFNVRVNSLGKALITWRPNFLTCAPIEQERVNNFITQKVTEITTKGLVPSQLNNNVSYDYSQITINLNDELDGESPNTNNSFIPFRKINLDVKKYRLIGAKLVIRYDGRADEEAGTITYGQYNGSLAPCLWGCPNQDFQIISGGLIQAMPAAGLSYMNAEDISDECAKFGKFDNIKILPHANTEVFMKGKRYSFFYFPLDNHAEEFAHSGGYGGIDSVSLREYADMTEDKTLIGYTSRFQGAHHTSFRFPGTTPLNIYGTSNKTTNDAGTDMEWLYERPEISNPSYVIGFSNMQPKESPTISCTVYETYEVIMDDEMNMLGGTQSNLNATLSFSRPENEFNPEEIKRAKSAATALNGSKADSLLERSIQSLTNTFSKMRKKAKGFLSNPIVKSAVDAAIPIITNMPK